MPKTNNALRLLERFRASEAAFNSGVPALMLRYRDEGAALLAEAGLPDTTFEDYQRSDINALFEQDIALTVELPSDDYASSNFLPAGFIDQCAIKGFETAKAVLLNDHFASEYSEGIESLSEAVFIGSIKTFLAQYPEREKQLARIYGRYAETDIDGTVALNTLLARDTLLIFVPEDVVVEKPIQVLQVLQADRDLLVAVRIMVVLEKDSSIELIFSDHIGNGNRYISNRVVEIEVGERARLCYYNIEQADGCAIKLSTTVLRQREESRVSAGEYTLRNSYTRNNYRHRFLGQRAELKLNGLVIGHKNCHADNFARVEHVVPDCRTDELFKYILQDNSVGIFTGRIFIALGAQKTLAYQQNRNLLLSPEARAFAKPHLEIYADDVHCSHGMTTGQLDSDSLFYMQQRGISLEEARTMLSIAFAEDVLATIEIPPVREMIRELVERNFYGTSYEGRKD